MIVDEIHAVAGTKRGAHLALSLERLEELTLHSDGKHSAQRIGLSATQRPLEELARFLGGQTTDGPRPVTIVDTGTRKDLDIEVIVPVDDMSELGSASVDDSPIGAASYGGDGYGAAGGSGAARTGIWPHVHPRLLELIRAHHSTLIFVNARRLAERLAAQLNELDREERGTADGPDLVARAPRVTGTRAQAGDRGRR